MEVAFFELGRLHWIFSLANFPELWEAHTSNSAYPEAEVFHSPEVYRKYLDLNQVRYLLSRLLSVQAPESSLAAKETGCTDVPLRAVCDRLG